MKKANLLKKLIWVITLFWMVLIFYFSSQPAEISKYESGSALAKLNLISEDQIQATGDYRVSQLQHFIRKSAHVVVYTALGMLLALSIIDTYFSKARSYTYAYILGTIYGITDEIHQMFVPGRGPMVRDVFIDSGSVLIGVLFILLITKFIGMIINKLHFAST